MRTPFIFAVSSLALACATGIIPDGSSETTPDSGGAFSGNDAGSNKPNTNTADAGNTNNTDQDAGNTNTCSGTMCGSQCVDTTSDTNNCGTCGNACPSTATCISSVCDCGSQTLCSNECVDTTSDNSNCGSCGKTCTSSETCTSGKCVATSDAPPQGSCTHSLCTSGKALSEGCDTEGCTIIICDPSYLDDEYCCETSWDSQCESEVTTYCSPYSCK